MTPADVLVALLVYVAEHAPQIASEVSDLIASFRAEIPELADPPPEDGEASVNEEIDRAIR